MSEFSEINDRKNGQKLIGGEKIEEENRIYRIKLYYGIGRHIVFRLQQGLF